MNISVYNSTLNLNSTQEIDTDEIDTDGIKILHLTIIVLSISIVIAILNICCLIILAKDKKLKEKRFEMLTICLSISDAGIGIISIALRSRTIYFRLTGENTPHFCYFFTILLIATFLFSLLQTLWICIERFIATFPTVTNPCRKMSIIGMTVALYVICVGLVLIYFLIYGNFWSTACNIQGILGNYRKTFLRIYQSTKLIIVFVIVLTYSGVLFRVYKSWRRIQPQLGNTIHVRQAFRRSSVTMTTVQTDFSTYNNDNSSQGHSSTQLPRVGKSKTRVMKTMKMAITLGILILVLLIAALPKIVIGLIVMNEPSLTPAHLVGIQISDLFIYLNPLLDPIIYVLRIDTFRERLKFKCGNTD